MAFEATSSFDLLLIEDNPGDARLLEKYLEKADTTILPVGIEFHHERSLTDGLDALETGEYDLLLLDLGLPESSGLETLHTVLETIEGIPVVVLTGLNDKEVAVEAIQQGAQDYLNKDDLDQELLTRTIRYAIERKEREETLKERTDQLEFLNRIVRHDIRNDVAVIRGWSEEIERSDSEEGVPYLERINDASRHIIDLTETARAFVDALSDDDDLRIEAMDLDHVLRDEIQKKRSAHDVTIDVPEELPPVTVTANELLSSVFGNLLSNAIRHNDAADPLIEVSLETVGDETVTVTIADNGPGVPESKETAIFGKGEKGRDSPGTGIGLYLVDMLVTQFGGEVEVGDSDLGGAAFSVTLPRAEEMSERSGDATSQRV